ncbi:MAG: hypothetical protein AB8F78_19580 [Saprospiraceae bacterium]
MNHQLFRGFAIISLLVVGFTASAQEVLMPKAYENTNVGIVYDREVSFPMTIHTNGFHAAVNVGKLKSYYKTSYMGVSLGHLKHPREYKRADPGSRFQGRSSYVFGKQNSLIPVRAYKGWKRYYSGKDKRRGVALGTSFEVGLTAGLVKPYVLFIAREGNSDGTENRLFTYDENPEAFADRERIEGAGGLRRGWSNLSILPGINAKAALHLDWGAFDELMRAVEAGIMVDVFPRNVDLLIPPADNTPLFINFYLALHLGKRR